MNKYEKKDLRAKIAENVLTGGGLYIFQNSNDKAELKLPRPTKTGLRVVGAGGEFQGDSYYLQYVQQGILRLVEVLQTPEEEKQILLGEAMNEGEKLILDQPDQVTTEGTVEHVLETKPLNEELQGENQTPVLLNEAPDGFIIVED